MNYAKINMFLLIVAIIGIAAALYFLFINKKDTNTQTEALLQMMGGKENSKSQTLNSKTSENAADDEPPVPTDEDWKKIYTISEKIYFKKPLTIHEKKIQKDFDSYIQADIAYCEEFYPIVEKIVKEEQLNEEEQAFYDENKEQVDSQVNHRRELALKQPPENSKSETLNSKLDGANPPVSIEERNKKILALFEDGVPKSVPQIKPLYMKATGHDPGKNLYRIFGKMEGKFLTPYKDGKITYYCLPEWFDGKKLKSEFKNKIN